MCSHLFPKQTGEMMLHRNEKRSGGFHRRVELLSQAESMPFSVGDRSYYLDPQVRISTGAYLPGCWS